MTVGRGCLDYVPEWELIENNGSDGLCYHVDDDARQWLLKRPDGKFRLRRLIPYSQITHY